MCTSLCMSAFKCTRKVYCKICSQEYNMSKTQWFWVDSDNFRSLDGLPLHHLVKAERCSEHAIFKPLTKSIQQFPSFEVVSDLVESERKHQHLNEDHDLPKSIYWPLNILKFMTHTDLPTSIQRLPGEESFGMDLHQSLLYQRKTLGRPRLDVSGFALGRAGRFATVVALPFFGVLGGNFLKFLGRICFCWWFCWFFLENCSPKLWCSCHFMSIFLIPESQFHPICLIWSDKIDNYRQRGH